jgi:hypothetical protein
MRAAQPKRRIGRLQENRILSGWLMSCLKWGIYSGTTAVEMHVDGRRGGIAVGEAAKKQFGRGWLDLRTRKCALAPVSRMRIAQNSLVLGFSLVVTPRQLSTCRSVSGIYKSHRQVEQHLS